MATKTNQELAAEVIAGKWGNGAERRRLLQSYGYDYQAVQSIVNALLAEPKAETDSDQSAAAERVLEVDVDLSKYDSIRLNISGYSA